MPEVDRSIRDVLKDDGIKTGAVLNMSREQYEAIPRMNFSTLKTGLIGIDDVDVSLIRETYEGEAPQPLQTQQDAFDRGSLTHMVLLQPELLVDRVAIWKGDRRQGAEWQAFQEENAGKIIVREADARVVQQACREFRSMPRIRELLRPCDTEVAVFVKEGRIYCKCLLDGVSRADSGLTVIIDPKTTRNGIDERSVMSSIRRFRYREQMGIYRRWFEAATGRKVDAVYLLFLSLPPQRIGAAVVKLTTAALQLGEARVLAALERLEESLDSDHWPKFCGDYLCDVSEWEIGDVELEGFEE
jgi:hypothetical protein